METPDPLRYVRRCQHLIPATPDDEGKAPPAEQCGGFQDHDGPHTAPAPHQRAARGLAARTLADARVHQAPAEIERCLFEFPHPGRWAGEQCAGEFQHPGEHAPPPPTPVPGASLYPFEGPGRYCHPLELQPETAALVAAEVIAQRMTGPMRPEWTSGHQLDHATDPMGSALHRAQSCLRNPQLWGTNQDDLPLREVAQDLVEVAGTVVRVLEDVLAMVNSPVKP